MTVIAHGGTAGAIVEIAGLVVLAGLVAAVWLKQRRLPDDAPADAASDEGQP
jgi:hypothetical protein